MFNYKKYPNKNLPKRAILKEPYDTANAKINCPNAIILAYAIKVGL